MKYILFLFYFISLMSCSKKTYKEITKNGIHYVSVKSFGAKGNGSTDDRPAIQKALVSGHNVYFPKGEYMLASKTITQGLLTMTEDAYAANIFFDEQAILIVSPHQPTDYIKPAVLNITAHKGIIKSIRIDGLRIDGNRDFHNINNTGILAYERKGAAIKKLILSNVTIKNVGGSGIHTQARYNNFNNIATSNCGSHGIGIINRTNIGIENEFYLDGYISTNDDAYSIDFSGPKKNKIALKGYGWKGVAKNIKSINSYRGIKTAGYWDLELENVLIEDSANNGFFVNVDAPGKTLNLKNFIIKNAKNNGMSLSGETLVNAENISLIGCKNGLKIRRAKAKIDGLLIDGKNKNISTIRMGQYGGVIKNFIVRNSSSKDKYPIWLHGDNVILENGKFINNHSISEIIVHETAKNVTLKNIKFAQDTNEKYKKKKGITNIQNKGSTTIIDCDFSNLRGKQIDDRVKRIEIKSSIGLNRSK